MVRFDHFTHTLLGFFEFSSLSFDINGAFFRCNQQTNEDTPTRSLTLLSASLFLIF